MIYIKRRCPQCTFTDFLHGKTNTRSIGNLTEITNLILLIFFCALVYLAYAEILKNTKYLNRVLGTAFIVYTHLFEDCTVYSWSCICSFSTVGTVTCIKMFLKCRNTTEITLGNDSHDWNKKSQDLFCMFQPATLNPSISTSHSPPGLSSG